MCDVTIVVQDRTFPAHKCILAAASEYFRTMFTVDFRERNEGTVSFYFHVFILLLFFSFLFIYSFIN